MHVCTLCTCAYTSMCRYMHMYMYMYRGLAPMTKNELNQALIGFSLLGSPKQTIGLLLFREPLFSTPPCPQPRREDKEGSTTTPTEPKWKHLALQAVELRLRDRPRHFPEFVVSWPWGCESRARVRESRARVRGERRDSESQKDLEGWGGHTRYDMLILMFNSKLYRHRPQANDPMLSSARSPRESF